MRDKAAKLKAAREKVMGSLVMSKRLTRAQLTVGPLRHMKPEERDAVLNSLAGDGLLKIEKLPREIGKDATGYALTPIGRKHAQTLHKAL